MEITQLFADIDTRIEAALADFRALGAEIDDVAECTKREHELVEALGFETKNFDAEYDAYEADLAVRMAGREIKSVLVTLENEQRNVRELKRYLRGRTSAQASC